MISKNFFCEKALKDWIRLTRAVVKFPALERFERYLDMVLRDMV